MANDNVIPLFDGENIPEDLASLSAIPVDKMSRVWLEKALAAAEDLLEQLDEAEPEDMDSDEYDQWADDHEEVEDFLDELRERAERL